MRNQMNDDDSRYRGADLTAHGKAAVITYLLVRTREITNAQIREKAGIKTLPGVYYLMDNLSQAGIPIWQPRPGVWSLLDD